MAEDWVNDARNEAKTDTRSEVEKEVGNLKEG